MAEPTQPQSSAPYKTARTAELFWLVTSVVTTCYVLYLWWTEDLTRWTLGLFPFISWLWFGVRRAFRIRMARPQ
ncbi:MAG: hypothetical protein VXZ86_06700 [Bacteroidota bacterium]|nr:hypothetical protein [Bacteroidota bacterium]